MSNNSMEYKGYVGTVEYSAEDECLFGRIRGIRDIISFEGESIAELRTDFENAVEDYFETCAEIGKTPQRPCSGKLSLRLPVNLYQELATQSENSGESVNSLVVEAVEALCKNRKRSANRSANRSAKHPAKHPTSRSDSARGRGKSKPRTTRTPVGAGK